MKTFTIDEWFNGLNKTIEHEVEDYINPVEEIYVYNNEGRYLNKTPTTLRKMLEKTIDEKEITDIQFALKHWAKLEGGLIHLDNLPDDPIEPIQSKTINGLKELINKPCKYLTIEPLIPNQQLSFEPLSLFEFENL